MFSDHQEDIRTAAQINRMSIHNLLQDPVRATIYQRGLADGSQSKKLQP
jgi:hypothetical protein